MLSLYSSTNEAYVKEKHLTGVRSYDPDITCVVLDVFKRSGSHITNHKHENMKNMTNI